MQNFLNKNECKFDNHISKEQKIWDGNNSQITFFIGGPNPWISQKVFDFLWKKLKSTMTRRIGSTIKIHSSNRAICALTSSKSLPLITAFKMSTVMTRCTSLHDTSPALKIERRPRKKLSILQNTYKQQDEWIKGRRKNPQENLKMVVDQWRMASEATWKYIKGQIDGRLKFNSTMSLIPNRKHCTTTLNNNR